MTNREFRLLRIKAFFGSASAHFLLGNNYLYGIGISPCIEKAYLHLKKSAQKGFAPAIDALKSAFEEDDNSMRLNSEWRIMYNNLIKLCQAAAAGDPEALYIKSEGKLLDKNTHEFMFNIGLKDMRKAAELNYPPAMFLLGFVYAKRDRIKGRKQEGLGLMSKAAEMGYQPAIDYLNPSQNTSSTNADIDAFPKATEIRFPHQITIDRSPRACYFDDTTKEAIFSGGWGYDGESALLILTDDESTGVDIEYGFIKYRAFKELNGHPSCGDCCEYQDIRCENVRQSLMCPSNGRKYDVLRYVVTAIPLKDWEWLKNDWESHNAYENDEAGRLEHFRTRQERTISYETECHFDITEFFGKSFLRYKEQQEVSK